MTKSKDKFFDWLRSETQARGWNMRELARKAEISPPAISDLLAFEKTPSLDMCKALAKAFDKSTLEVLILAGHVAPPEGWAKDQEEVRDLFNALTEQDRDLWLATGRAIRETRKKYAADK